MAANDIYQVTVYERFGTGGEKVSTNYWYLAEDTNGSALNLYNVFTDTDKILDGLLDLQGGQFQVDSVKVINLFSLTDFYEGQPGGSGTGGSVDELPIFNAINFTKKINTRGIRPGSLRVPGIWEAVQARGVISDSGYLTLVNSFRVALGNQLIGDADATYTPVVVGRIKYTVGTGEDAHDAYRLPENQGEANYGVVTTVLVNTRISHQTSRGNGR